MIDISVRSVSNPAQFGSGITHKCEKGKSLKEDKKMKARSLMLRDLIHYCLLIGVLIFVILASIPLHAQGITGCTEGITDYWKLDESSGTTFADSVGTSNASCTPPCVPGFCSRED